MATNTTQFLILPGQEEAFQTLAAGLRTEFRPTGTLQDFLFNQILHASWNLERCHNAEAQIFALTLGLAENPNQDPLLAETNEAKLKLIAQYANRAQQSYSRFVAELRRVQSEALYRLSVGNQDEPISVLVDTRAVDKQIAADTLRIRQAMLAEVRALCEQPMPDATPPPCDGQAAPKPAQTPASSQPESAPEQTKPFDSAGARLGFSRNSIFRRNRGKNRNAQRAA